MTIADLSDDVGVGIQVMIQEARRLGLIWGLRPATATGVSTVIYDGDNEEIPIISLIGLLDTDMRVMVMFVPPGGNYVIGTLNANTTGRTVRDIVQQNSTLVTGVNLTTTPYVVAGISYTVTTTRPGVMWMANWCADIQSIAAGTTTAVCRLAINGTWSGGPHALFNQANVTAGARVTVGNGDVGTFDNPGEYTFTLEALRSGGADNILKINGLHTRLTIITFA